jgi:signal transduction histidine kinase/DNA-binding response OmpR family regulator/streptogramin lyase
MKDSKGFMWFGTGYGLNKYDGYKFKVYVHSSKDTTTITDDFIVSLNEGPDNKIWVEMRNHINIFDPITETFNHDVAGYLKSIHIYDAYVTSVKKDALGNFWFLHPGYGIYKYTPSTKTTIHIEHKPGDPNSISSNDVGDVTADTKGNIWLIDYNGLIEELNDQNEVIYRFDLISKHYSSTTVPFKLFIDNKDDFWAYVPTYSSGVYYLSADKSVFKHLDKGTAANNLSTNVISQIIQDDKGRIWIATDQGGINILDKSNFEIKVILNREDDNKSLSQNGIISMYKDNTGIIWIGTFKKGISYYNEKIIKFPLYTHHFSDPNSLPFNDVNKFIEDKYGNLWLGTNGGGLIYFDRKKNTFKSYLHNTSDPNSLSNNVIVTMFMDHDQKLWIGTYFGGLDCFDGKTFVHYRHNDALPGSISEDRIWSILEDADHKLWVGTLAGGLNLFHPETKTFTHYTRAEPSSAKSLSSNYIPALMQDHDKNLWIVTSYGFDEMLYKTNRIIHYKHDEHNNNSLVDNNTNNIFLDSRNLIWITSRGGISIFNPLTGKFQNITRDDGLPDNTTIDIQEDRIHNMWVSTANGLSNIIVNKSGGQLSFNFINYNETDGLQGREFNANASCKTREGELMFGGANGFNLFNPLNIHIDNTPSNLVFTDFQVFNQSVKVGDKINGHVILNQSITTATSVTLRHDEDAFAIAFASLNYFNPDKIKIQYKMQGFDKDWINADNAVRKANYTNLDAGDYVFKVRTLNKNIVTKEVSLAIHILPPFWKTPLAYLLYAVVFSGSLFFIRKRGIQRLKTQFELEKEREEAKRMHELDLMKIKFFTNISHEFRTPLSLIMAPIDKVLKQMKEPEVQKQLEFANRNARRLLNMVNQLLDFRKMESQELKLNMEKGEIISFISDVALSFNDIAEKKNISFIFNSEIDELNCEFDRDKIERILFNILSNAFKFTPAGGHVSVLVNAGEIYRDHCELEIKVIDTGIGITQEKIDRIFEPFFQDDIPGSMINQGSGIGLSITKEFVKLHNGTIKAKSQNNEGSTFTVVIPLKIIPVKESTAIKNGIDDLAAESVNAVDKAHASSKKPTVLIVEDDYDFRFYIKDNLKSSFTIIEATDGKEGWQKTLASHPNIIVSDISMPEMDGIELCRKVKADSRTTHIPVILLTALTGEEQQLKGLETGATDYMTKPFNFEILLSRIRNILVQQENMRKTYQKQVEVKPTDVIVESPDEVFLQKLLRLIEENISNPNFSVEELSGDMFMSRYTLYKKILALTGKTPNEFIRYMRLKRAAQLLENGYLTVSQICYKVGFKSQKYFVKAFKSEFNVSPSNYSETRDHAEV